MAYLRFLRLIPDLKEGLLFFSFAVLNNEIAA
jgi:hypothetical protein